MNSSAIPPQRPTVPFSSPGLVKKVAATLAVLILGLPFSRVIPAESGAAADHPIAPAWKLNDVDGKIVSLSDFKGKVVILDFWATWCPPCRKEIPDFVELQKKYGERGLVIVGVSLDEQGAAVVAPFVKKNGITYPIVLGGKEISEAYDGIEVLPTTFVIDRTGKVVKGHRGFTERSVFEAEITPLL